MIGLFFVLLGLVFPAETCFLCLSQLFSQKLVLALSFNELCLALFVAAL